MKTLFALPLVLAAVILASCSTPAPSGSKNFQEAYKILTDRTKAIEKVSTCEEFIQLTAPMEDYDLLYEKLSVEEQSKLNTPTIDLMIAINKKNKELDCMDLAPTADEIIETESIAEEE